MTCSAPKVPMTCFPTVQFIFHGTLQNWPEENCHVVYGKELILKACHDVKIIHTYDVVHEVKWHIKVDPEFTKGLSDLVSSMFYISCHLTIFT